MNEQMLDFNDFPSYYLVFGWNCRPIYALMLVGSKLNICCSLFNSFLYNILLSAQNNMADNHSKNTPTTARPKDQDRKLWSWSGIQSLSSPLMPNIITAIVENRAIDTINLIDIKYLQKVYSRYNYRPKTLSMRALSLRTPLCR